VGPDFHPAVHPAVTGFTPKPLPVATVSAPARNGAAEILQPGGKIAYDWWTMFHSPPLDRLVRRALAHSPTIEAARATLRGARFDVYAQLGFFYPTVNAEYNFQRQQLAGNLNSNAPGVQGNGRVILPQITPGVPPYNEPVTYSLHTAQLTVGYTPDVFGSNTRQVESLRAQMRYQRFELEAASLTLASNVVAAAIQEASLRDQIDAARLAVTSNQAALDVVQRRFATGYASRVDVAQQQSLLASAEAAVPPLEKQLEQTRDLLRSLTGDLQDKDEPETFTLASLELPKTLPLSVPSDLVEQRPDIRAAQEQWHEATANVGVAVAARLPAVNLTANAGGVAAEFDQMFSHGGPFWSIAADFTQPLFDGFTLYNKERSARAAMRTAAAQYRAAVVTAYQNVADSLQAILADGRAYATAVAAEDAARVGLQAARDQEAHGYADVLALITAETAYDQAVELRIQAEAARLGDAAALYVALGGGWWNRPEEKG
jgi:NodT family efflux transporter outer membrane factor (OMF) lipoprotein